MPKRTDIATILIIGAGPIVIGQACEFDYSGTQACKALKAEGYRIVLVNSNPATIMTDPDLAHATYVEPITPEIVAKIIAKERHHTAGGFALLPTMGGQTALNTALSLKKMGVLDRFDVEMIRGGQPTPSTWPEDPLAGFGVAMARMGSRRQIAPRQRSDLRRARPRAVLPSGARLPRRAATEAVGGYEARVWARGESGAAQALRRACAGARR
jgi:hypothetical protein